LVALLLALLIVISTVRSIARPLQALTIAADRLASGDMTTRIHHDSDDEIGSLVQSFTHVTSVLGELVSGTRTLAEAASRGELGRRADADRFQGAFRELVLSINATVEAMEQLTADAERRHAEAMQFLSAAGSVLERVARRDLSARVVGHYEGEFGAIQRALNTALDNLDTALAEVASAARQVASAADQIAGGSEELALRASEQAAVLEEVGSGLHELNAMTRANAKHAIEVRSLAEGAHEIASAGEAGMARLSRAMEEIKASSNATTKIVKTIDEIAFQTNLLALNAAV